MQNYSSMRVYIRDQGGFEYHETLFKDRQDSIIPGVILNKISGSRGDVLPYR